MKLQTIKAWIWYTIVQMIMGLATLLGLLVLIIPCLLQAWELSPPNSIKDRRPIDHWKLSWLNYLYGNPEDGVSGQTALIWSGGKETPYLPDSNPSWRAYSWSALRNSCDNLKYVFQWAKGPILYNNQYLTLGWSPENGINVPVFGLHL